MRGRNGSEQLPFKRGLTDLAVKPAPAGEHGVLAQARRRPRFPSAPCGRVDHLQLSVTQRPVDAHARRLPCLLTIGAAQPYGKKKRQS